MLCVTLCLFTLAMPSLCAGQAPATLKQAFGSQFAIGTALANPAWLRPNEIDVLLANFTNLTPEACMKPKPTEPEEDKYTFEQGDALVKFAQQHHLKVNGHCLVWHNTCPDWFFLDHGHPAGRELVLRRMIDHITTEVGHFKGSVFSWDVVNEAISDGDDFFKPTKWWSSIGDDFVAQAFMAADRADPGAELYYNDYGIEKPVKRAKAIRLIRDLKKQHIRIEGIGIQGHWRLDRVPYQDLEDSIIAFHNEGLKVMITELDLDVVSRKESGADASAREQSRDDPYPSACPPEVLQRQADQYAKLFALFEKHADMISRVTFWGLDDGRSWLNNWPRKRTNYPLLWDRQAQPKPALAAVLAEAKK